MREELKPSLADRLRDLIPVGDGHFSEYAGTLAEAAEAADERDKMQRVLVLAIKYCPQDSRDWPELIKLADDSELLPKMPEQT